MRWHDESQPLRRRFIRLQARRPACCCRRMLYKRAMRPMKLSLAPASMHRHRTDLVAALPHHLSSQSFVAPASSSGFLLGCWPSRSNEPPFVFEVRPSRTTCSCVTLSGACRSEHSLSLLSCALHRLRRQVVDARCQLFTLGIELMDLVVSSAWRRKGFVGCVLSEACWRTPPAQSRMPLHCAWPRP